MAEGELSGGGLLPEDGYGPEDDELEAELDPGFPGEVAQTAELDDKEGEKVAPSFGEQDPLAVALSLRVPVFRRRDRIGPKEKIERLEEYMLLSAFVQGNLAEARNLARERLDEIEEEYEDVDVAYYLDRKPRTQKDIEEGRRRANPELHQEVAYLKKRVVRLTEEERRLERDAKICSRAYSPYLS